jgi:hypothetical protein
VDTALRFCAHNLGETLYLLLCIYFTCRSRFFNRISTPLRQSYRSKRSWNIQTEIECSNVAQCTSETLRYPGLDIYIYIYIYMIGEGLIRPQHRDHLWSIVLRALRWSSLPSKELHLTAKWYKNLFTIY